jgi:hypothetical protein
MAAALFLVNVVAEYFEWKFHVLRSRHSQLLWLHLFVLASINVQFEETLSRVSIPSWITTQINS